ncbi:MAG TPA: hypothetical protein VLV78_15800 [Thermoanaerobaculia bacterium]|nr:hypothetical protein [Thermoanaerobaculia bacterium]
MTEIDGERSPKAASSDAAFVFLESFPRASAFELAGKLLVIDCDQPAVARELFVAFGSGRPAGQRDRRQAFMLVELVRARPDALALAIYHDGTAVPPQRVFFGLAHPHCPYRSVRERSGWTQLLVGDDPAIQFSFDNKSCFVHRTDVWPQAVVSAVMRIFRRLADDVIFIHSSAVGVGGRAVLFVGPPNSGKSTIALALTARRHELLSDEFGCLEPATGNVLPFRRPVGVRPGPRAAAVDVALAQARAVEDRDSLRVDVGTLLPLTPERALPLGAIVFLDGFAPEPSFRDVAPGYKEVGALVSADASMSDVSTARRTFTLMQLLAKARVGYLNPGDPDRTAIYLEEVFRS